MLGSAGWLRRSWPKLAPFLFMPMIALSASAQSNLELWELTNTNPPFSRNVYLCVCTVEQYNAVPLPGPNWLKNAGAGGAPRFFLPDSGTNDPPVPPSGIPTSLDLIAEIPGDDHLYIARVLSGTVLGFGSSGPFSIAFVERLTILTYNAGSILQKVIAADGSEYALFSYDSASVSLGDPTVLNGLATIMVGNLPAGWSYSSQVLNEPLSITSGGVAEVFAQGFGSWQKINVVDPTPVSALGPFGLALLLGSILAIAMLHVNEPKPPRRALSTS